MYEYCERDGLIRRNGEIWHPDKCKECRCDHNVVFCNNLACPPPSSDCSRMSHVEGECCSVCAGIKPFVHKKKCTIMTREIVVLQPQKSSVEYIGNILTQKLSPS